MDSKYGVAINRRGKVSNKESLEKKVERILRIYGIADNFKVSNDKAIVAFYIDKIGDKWYLFIDLKPILYCCPIYGYKYEITKDIANKLLNKEGVPFSSYAIVTSRQFEYMEEYTKEHPEECIDWDEYEDD